ncbi:hypothetical protein B5X24_HaOG202550 [Helicoverpa armigera]|uniref:Sperm microtubule inner protein 1 C-terminal domain-containing protein n=1 Tax=Helicoverpa armigera TaxID=29058 RepID=A0A2W1BWY4_HELAM|nr:hypothetical protein B5X24_HaOG202550 [Helicoverpa armigera]
MPKDFSNPAVIILLKEAYDREKRLRAKWISKNREKLEKAVTLNREPTNYFEEDVAKQNMIGVLPSITLGHIAARENRKKTPLRDARTIPAAESIRHEHSIINMGLGSPSEDPRLARPDTDFKLDPIMRPVNAKLKKLLMKPRPTFGREVYLKKRTKEDPGNKYYFPECTSWDHGWRLQESSLLERATYGRIWQLNRSLRSRVGPQPDPEHYYPPSVPCYAKCASNIL